MAYIKKFEKPETLHNRSNKTATSNYDPWDNPSVKNRTDKETSFFNAHLKQYADLISWARWYPDLFLDLMREKDPETGKPKNGVVLHFDQRVFLRSIFRFSSVYGVFPRGWGKCVATGTYLFTDEGMLPIDHFFNCEENGVEDYTPELDFSVINLRGKREPVGYGVYNGYKETKKIKTNYGYEIECSKNHPILIMRNNKRTGEDVMKYVLAKDIKPTDKILISTQNEMWGNKTRLEVDYSKFTKTMDSFPKHINEDLAYLFGYIIARGKFNGEGIIVYSVDVKRAKMFWTVLRRFGIEAKKVRKTGVFISSPGFVKCCEQLSIGYTDEKEKQIPLFMLMAPREIVIAMLKGLFDSCGYVEKKGRVGFFTCSKEMLKQTQLLLLNLGIVAKQRIEETGKFKNIYELRISGKNISLFRDIINFTSPKNRNRMTRLTHRLNRYYIKRYYKNYFIDDIDTIEDGENHVYDISVPETHSFVSNGIISHNTWGEVISMFLMAILYPGITLSMTAQTKANAAELLNDKYNEIVKKYPLLKNEMYKPRKSKDDFELSFVNGSRIDVLANAQSSKGQRRNRIQIEESALLDNETYTDALAPIVNIGRITSGSNAVTDPMELNQQINFFTTAGYRGSCEWSRSIDMYKNMTDLKGEIVLGSGWLLGCWMGRGETKSQILKQKRKQGIVSFAKNYEERWVGAVDNQLVDLKKLMESRVLTDPVFDNRNRKEGNNSIC